MLYRQLRNCRYFALVDAVSVTPKTAIAIGDQLPNMAIEYYVAAVPYRDVGPAKTNEEQKNF